MNSPYMSNFKVTQAKVIDSILEIDDHKYSGMLLEI